MFQIFSSEEVAPPLENPEKPDPVEAPSEKASPVVTPISSVISIQEAEHAADNSQQVSLLIKCTGLLLHKLLYSCIACYSI